MSDSPQMKFEEVETSVDASRPLIYLWEVLDSTGSVLFRYVGKASGGAKRPRSHYRRNVNNVLKGGVYRKGKPQAFREIHLRMANAVRRGERLRLTFLCNVADAEDINEREMYWQRRYDAVTKRGQKVTLAVTVTDDRGGHH